MWNICDCRSALRKHCEHIQKTMKPRDVTIWPTCVFDCWQVGQEVPKLSPSGTHFFPIRLKTHPAAEKEEHFTLLVVKPSQTVLFDIC